MRKSKLTLNAKEGAKGCFTWRGNPKEFVEPRIGLKKKKPSIRSGEKENITQVKNASACIFARKDLRKRRAYEREKSEGRGNFLHATGKRW